MMKVCHISSLHKWNDTRIFFKECKTLAEAGYDVSLVAPNAVTKVVDKVHVIGVQANSENRFYRMCIVTLKVFLAALRTHSKIIHFHDPELIFVGILMRFFGKKVVYDVHENVKAQIRDKEWLVFPGFFAFVYSIAEWIAAKLFYIVIAEESYEEIYLGKAKSITKVQNFPDLTALEPFKTQNISIENGILYVGSVSKLRGIFEILNALKILEDKNIDFYFHCIGPISNDLQNEIDNSDVYKSIQKKVKFYGPLPIYEAYNFAKKSKLGLSILHPVPNYLRSFSTKIFEYMSLGLPFIVSDFELYSFVKEKHLGICVDPMNVSEISRKIEDVLLEKIDLEAMRSNQEQAIKDYTWQSQAENLLHLYSTITKSVG